MTQECGKNYSSQSLLFIDVLVVRQKTLFVICKNKKVFLDVNFVDTSPFPYILKKQAFITNYKYAYNHTL